MKISIIMLAAAVVLASAPTQLYASTCYKMVGGACVSSSTGNKDSTCTNDCAVGLQGKKNTSQATKPKHQKKAPVTH